MTRLGMEKRSQEEISQLVWLRDVDGLTLKEIGRRVGLSHERVRFLYDRFKRHQDNYDPVLALAIKIRGCDKRKSK